jgi:2-oxo-4-hydroxy-4-carboxy-5-ureidoimidazoline decarboxylase
MAPLSLNALNQMDRSAFTAALGDIFEHSPWIAEQIQNARPFSTLAQLYSAMTAAVRGAAADRQMTLIRAHPDLAGKAAREGSITPDSKREQSSAGLDHLSDAEYDDFQKLNGAYRDKFGIPFIVCVRRHSKDSILRQFRRRLDNDRNAERGAALEEIFRIAALRLDQRITAPDRLNVHGRLSTHVLDTHGGHPAANVTVELFEVFASGGSRPILRTATNADGRTDKPLIADQPIPIADYELRFGIGEYFTSCGALTTDPPFLGLVLIRFAVAEPESHYHVPLLVTPWSYSTYRGS